MASPEAAQATWQERVHEKQSRILSGVPQSFIHQDLKFSDVEAFDCLDLPVFSDSNPARVQDIPSRLLTQEELDITALRAEDIPEAIGSGKYSAVQILNAFTHRAVIAHQLLHCCLTFMYPEALEHARSLDREFGETGKLRGPLHGVPFSVKDQCRIKGTETTCGFVANLGSFDQEDCLLVTILKNAGAIPFCKTTLSVGCLWGESINHIIGRASNAFNRKFTCGGSSGGEGALIGFKGSPLGIGSDLGGSIRTPACYNGLHSLRPSSSRIPYYQILNSMEGQEIIPSVVGPLARSTESLRLFCKAVVDARPWLVDPKSPPIPWRDDAASAAADAAARPLRVAVMHWDGHVLPHPPLRRALREAERRLRATGHDVVPMFDVEQPLADRLGSRVVVSDADADVQRSRDRSGEPRLALVDPATHGTHGHGHQPEEPRPVPMTLLESWALAVERYEYQARILRRWGETAGTTRSGEPIDVYVTAVNPSVAHVHGDFGRVRYKGYCAVANVLDFSACTLPVGFAGPDDVADRSDVLDGHGNALPPPACDKDRWTRENYGRNLEEYAGQPLVLQIVAKRYEEEKLLAISQRLEDLFKE
ncbi:acetamidase [Xylariaceae sp. FL0804]|nr:acetamidase [Xylariaceae sp. FL0804]